MPTPPKGPRLGGSPAHERLILANLAQSLFEHGKITTTETKAKRLRPHAEKLITTAKKGTLHSRREVLKTIRNKDVLHKLFAEIAPSFATRDGGYTRIIKTAPRKGDNAPMAIIELVTEETVSASASRVARRAASTRGDRSARVAASSGATAAADSATDAEDSPDRESGSVQAVEAGSEAPAEGALDASADAAETDAAETDAAETDAAETDAAETDAVSATDAEDSPDRESGSAQAVEAGSEAPAEGADETK